MVPLISGSAVRPGVKCRFGRRVEDIAQPVDGDARLMKILPDLRQPQHRLRNAARQHIESHQFADRHIAVDDRLRAEEQNRGRDEFVDELDALACPVAEIGDAEAGADIARQLFFPAALHLRLDRQRFQGFNAGDAFNQKRLVLRAAIEFFIEATDGRPASPEPKSRYRTGKKPARCRSATANKTPSRRGTRR